MVLECTKLGSNLLGHEGTTRSISKCIEDVMKVVFKVLDWTINKLIEIVEGFSDMIEIFT